MSCWSLGSISLKAGLPWAGEGPATWWEGMLQNRVWPLSRQKQSQVRSKLSPALPHDISCVPGVMPKKLSKTKTGAHEPVTRSQHRLPICVPPNAIATPCPWVLLVYGEPALTGPAPALCRVPLSHPEHRSRGPPQGLPQCSRSWSSWGFSTQGATSNS